MASCDFKESMSASVKISPVARYLLAPRSYSFVTYSTPEPRVARFIASRAMAVTSGPMPSPPMTPMLICLDTKDSSELVYTTLPRELPIQAA